MERQLLFDIGHPDAFKNSRVNQVVPEVYDPQTDRNPQWKIVGSILKQI